MSASTKCCSSGEGKVDNLECNESILGADAQMLHAEIEV